jgi:hypothetical protein
MEVRTEKHVYLQGYNRAGWSRVAPMVFFFFQRRADFLSSLLGTAITNMAGASAGPRPIRATYFLHASQLQ